MAPINTGDSGASCKPQKSMAVTPIAKGKRALVTTPDLYVAKKAELILLGWHRNDTGYWCPPPEVNEEYEFLDRRAFRLIIVEPGEPILVLVP